MKQIVFIFSLLALTLLTACVGGSRAMRSGGEVTGQRAVNYNEPAPFGMIEVKRGFLRAGMETDSLWGLPVPQREISVDGFWMDQTEVTNSMYRQFVEFDILWIRELLSGGIIPGLNILDWNGSLLNTDWPLAILSLTGLGFRNGLYIFLLRQFYKGVPDELEESAYIDGSGVFRTFFTIIIPLSVPMLITVFLFAFSWQWTDNFYTELFYRGEKAKILMPDIVKVPKSLKTDYPGTNMYNSAIYNTAAFLIIIPLIVIYLFCQRYLVQGIARSGLTGE